jgi:hypothetical protein
MITSFAIYSESTAKYPLQVVLLFQLDGRAADPSEPIGHSA